MKTIIKNILIFILFLASSQAFANMGSSFIKCGTITTYPLSIECFNEDGAPYRITTVDKIMEPVPACFFKLSDGGFDIEPCDWDGAPNYKNGR